MPDAHTSVPYVYPPVGDQRRAWLDKHMDEARTATKELLILGSSIYTVGGNGGISVASLQAEFAEMYGNCPGTGWLPFGSFGTTPPSQLGVRGSSSAGAGVPGAYSSTYQLPSFDIYKLTDYSGNVIQFEPACHSTAITEFGIPGAYYTAGDTYRPEWIATAAGGFTTDGASNTTFGWATIKRTTAITYAPWSALFSAAVNTLGRTQLSAVPNVNFPSTDLNGRTVALNSGFDAFKLGCPASNGAVPTTYTHDSSAPYYNFIIENGSQTGRFYACAQRWTNQTSKAGWIVSSASKSGCKIGQVVADHPNSGPIIRAMAPDVVVIALHTNSAGNNIKARDDASPTNSYYHLALELIDFVRLYAPNCGIVLLSDGPRTDFTAPQETEYSQMVGANRDICDVRPRCIAVNLLLALEDAGYSKATQTFTGYTFRGLWATATSYSVGDIVSLDGGGEVRYARCIVAHTSGSTTKPFLGSVASDNWRRHRGFLVPNPDPTSTVSDAVHPGGWGARYAARLTVKLLTSGVWRRGKVRGRER